ncbi:MAG: hypothetical protein WBC65_09380 [Ignavibacteria bacterium]|nr:hypothetical protein [Ignavibacteria bacterium]
MIGIANTLPAIKKISFEKRGMMDLNLRDGRIVSIPTRYFPKIKKLNSDQRKKWYVIDEQMFSFDDCNEVYHLEQVLGKETKYKYEFPKKSA